jgi:hypothetical protein
MRRHCFVPGKFITAWIFVTALLFVNSVTAQDDWEFSWAIYGWLPIIENETASGEKSEITRDDILDDLDLFGFSFLRARTGNWTLSTDFVYFKISDKPGLPLISDLPAAAELDEAGMQAWVIRPAVGYVVHETDKRLVELYGGARYLWIEIDAKFDLSPLLEGSTRRRTSPSEGYWDAIVGVRGTHWLNDKWFTLYSVNAGTGDSDFTWEAQAAFVHRFKKLDAVAGWRYLYYDIGSDDVLKELSVNGPYVGAMFHW